MRRAIANYLTNPRVVEGANDWTYRWTPGDPVPVVLIHGTFVNASSCWHTLAPYLAQSRAVYAPTFGAAQLSLGGRLSGMAHVRDSARVVEEFCARVLDTTGAPALDLVGHSLGGLIATYLGERSTSNLPIRTYCGIAPSNHGTEFYHQSLTKYWFSPALRALTGPVGRGAKRLGWGAVPDQVAGSPFLQDLWHDGDDTHPDRRYVTIASESDFSVTPVSSQFLAGESVTNIRLQDICPTNTADHRNITFDDCVLSIVRSVLDGREPTCAQNPDVGRRDASQTPDVLSPEQGALAAAHSGVPNHPITTCDDSQGGQRKVHGEKV